MKENEFLNRMYRKKNLIPIYDVLIQIYPRLMSRIPETTETYYLVNIISLTNSFTYDIVLLFTLQYNHLRNNEIVFLFDKWISKKSIP